MQMLRAVPSARAVRVLLLSLLLGSFAVLGKVPMANAQAPTAAETAPKVEAPQTQPQRSFLPRPPGAAAPTPPGTTAQPGAPVVATGPLQSLYFWLAFQQRAITNEMTRAVRDLKAGGGVWAALVLSGISFLYGVLHAAGPGHGKAVIASYVLADRQTVRRGTILAFLSAFVQALSALVLVAIISLTLRATRVEMAAAEKWLERASWAFVTLVGLWLLYSQLKALGWLTRGKTQVADTHSHAHAKHDHAHALDHGPKHGHHHTHDHATHDHAHHGHKHSHDGHGHGHGHSHAAGDACATCGHAHMPSPEAVRDNWSLKRALTLAFAVGIRPCTGAILVLIFAIGQGLLWAGVVATFAMAIGTAITVSLLAALAVTSRQAAERLAGGSGGRWASHISTAAGLMGGLLVTTLGALFFVYSLGPAQPF